jgi:hypothetical protein
MPTRPPYLTALAAAVFASVLGAVACCHADGSAAPASWAAMADEVSRRGDLAEALKPVLDRARKAAANPLVKRVYRYADIGKDRSGSDTRTRFMDGLPRQEIFALAKSDSSTAGAIASELPLLAFAYRCTGEEPLRARVIAQLEEASTWSPMQRPGWSLGANSPAPVPDNFWDGSWLATGQGIRAIGDTLDLMPEGSIPPEVMEKVRALLRAEVQTITDDWKLQRGWFRKGDGRPNTNQWVLPTEGLIRACLILGKDQYPEQYEMGVQNLLRSMDIEGKDGEWSEGIGYAMITVNSMISVAHAMAAHGDMRALDHPFFRGFPAWAVYHYQPGRFRINSFDSGGARTARSDGGARSMLATLAVFAASPVARWALETLYDGPPDSLIGLLARTVPVPAQAPPTFAFYEGPARRVNWRSSWEDSADGVWVRGGHPLDSHDHLDRGHVNYIAGGKPLLIEAGTPGYENPRISTLYTSAVGHNVLDVEGIQPVRAPAPLAVARLDAAGGDVTVDGTAGYPGLQRWERRITWDSAGLQVADRVSLPADKPAAMLFRWHLGTNSEATITGAGSSWQVAWPDGTLTLEGSVPVEVTQERLPDFTVALGEKVDDLDFMHTCVVVRTHDPVFAWDLRTAVERR